MHLNSNQQPSKASAALLWTPVRPSPVWPRSPGPSSWSSNLHLFIPFAGHLCYGSHTCPPQDVPMVSSSLFSPRSNAASSRKPPWTTSAKVYPSCESLAVVILRCTTAGRHGLLHGTRMFMDLLSVSAGLLQHDSSLQLLWGRDPVGKPFMLSMQDKR